MRVENFALQLFDTAPKKRSLLGQSEECAITKTSFVKSDFSIGHRGACMQYPEHTIESYKAAAMQELAACDGHVGKALNRLKLQADRGPGC